MSLLELYGNMVNCSDVTVLLQLEQVIQLLAQHSDWRFPYAYNIIIMTYLTKSLCVTS